MNAAEIFLSIILIILGLFFLAITALGIAKYDSTMIIVGTVMASIVLFPAYQLMRSSRKKKPKILGHDIVGDPIEQQEHLDIDDQTPRPTRSTRFASDSAESTSHPVNAALSPIADINENPPAIDHAPDYKTVKRTGKVFKNVSYKGGLPSVESGFFKTNALHIAVAESGILFFDTRRKSLRSQISWQNLVAISTGKEMQGFHQSILTGAASRAGSIRDGVVIGVLGAILEKSPLVIRFKQHQNDEFVQEALFDDPRNTKLKVCISETRARLFPQGMIHSAQLPPSVLAEDEIHKIEKLAELKNRGIISEEEFNEKKKAILDRI